MSHPFLIELLAFRLGSEFSSQPGDESIARLLLATYEDCFRSWQILTRHFKEYNAIVLSDDEPVRPALWCLYNYVGTVAKSKSQELKRAHHRAYDGDFHTDMNAPQWHAGSEPKDSRHDP